MNNKQIRILLSFVAGGTALLITVGNGCSNRSDLNSLMGSSSSNSNNSSGAGDGTEPIKPGVKMVSVVYAKQMLDQVTSCVGLKKPSDSTIRVYQQKSGAISLYGDAASVTAPMMMAATSIVAEVCNDLIQQEKAAVSPHIFVNWNLRASAASTSLPANRDINDAVSRIALSCWQKAPSNQEMIEIVDLAVTENPTRESSALMLCTAMLSSLKTLLN
jgi:hypothetical protein